MVGWLVLSAYTSICMWPNEMSLLLSNIQKEFSFRQWDRMIEYIRVLECGVHTMFILLYTQMYTKWEKNMRMQKQWYI